MKTVTMPIEEFYELEKKAKQSEQLKKSIQKIQRLQIVEPTMMVHTVELSERRTIVCLRKHEIEEVIGKFITGIVEIR